MAAVAAGSTRAERRERTAHVIARVVVILGWIVVLLMGSGYGLMLQWLGDAVCEPTPGSSQYGTFGWSLLPPGPTCTFTAKVHGFDEVRGPSPVMSIWLAILVGGLVLIWWFGRRLKERSSTTVDSHF